MNNAVYIENISLISPLGKTISENIQAIEMGKSGITILPKVGFHQTNLPLSKCAFESKNRFDVLLEESLVASAQLLKEKNINSPHLIVSSTKGNLNLLPNDCFYSTKTLVKKYFPTSTLSIISNACISGVLAIQHAANLIKIGEATDVLVIGIDSVSDFVTFGFQSLFALSDVACKPFDATRNGTTLGEACGSVLVTNKKGAIQVLGGSSSNDANHISGPSRTGEGLVRSIERTIKRAGVKVSEIDFISAHGTATVFNDEMESIAFDRMGMNHIPLNSLKGYFGHTLGAAGVIETIISMESMIQNRLFASFGYEECGTTKSLNIIPKNQESRVHTILKTASGFGGGNASIILQKQPWK